MAMKKKKKLSRGLATTDKLPKIRMPIVSGEDRGRAVLIVKAPYQGFNKSRKEANQDD